VSSFTGTSSVLGTPLRVIWTDGELSDDPQARRRRDLAVGTSSALVWYGIPGNQRMAPLKFVASTVCDRGLTDSSRG
jgi:hypothetical protein